MLKNSLSFDYSKSSGRFNKKWLITIAVVTVLLIISTASFFYLRNNVNNTDSVTNQSTNSTLTQKVALGNPRVRINYPSSWEAVIADPIDEGADDPVFEQVDLSDKESASSIRILVYNDRENKLEPLTSKMQDILIADYDGSTEDYASEAFTDYDLKDSKIITTGNSSATKKTWYSRKITYTENGKDRTLRYLYPLFNGSVTIDAVADYETNQDATINNIIAAIEI